MAVSFSGLPDDYGSVFGELTYTISDVAPGAVASVEIYTDADSKKPIGVKRFKSDGSVIVNVSNYLRRRISPNPFAANRLEFLSDKMKYVKAYLKCGGNSSAVQVFTGATRTLYPYELLSRLPLKRKIAWDESEEISFVIPTSRMGYVCTLSGSRVYEVKSIMQVITGGVVTFIFGMPALAAKLRAEGVDLRDFNRINLKIKSSSDVIAEISYQLCERGGRAVRLCWVNSMGGIDYHTFEPPLSEHIAVSKETLLSRSGYVGSDIRKERYVEVTSGYLPSLWLEGLSEVLSSPLVWRVDEDDRIAADVLADNITLSSESLNSVDFTIRDKRPVTCQNY